MIKIKITRLLQFFHFNCISVGNQTFILSWLSFILTTDSTCLALPFPYNGRIDVATQDPTLSTLYYPMGNLPTPLKPKSLTSVTQGSIIPIAIWLAPEHGMEILSRMMVISKMAETVICINLLLLKYCCVYILLQVSWDQYSLIHKISNFMLMIKEIKYSYVIYKGLR